MKFRVLLSLILVFVLVTSMAFATTRSGPLLQAKPAAPIIKLAPEINITIDKASWKPLEADGKPLVPILVNGRLYLPFRAVLERFGVGILYDAAAKKLDLTSRVSDIRDKSSPVLIKVVEATKEKPSPEVIFDSKLFEGLPLKDMSQETSFTLAENAIITVSDSPSQVGAKATFKEFTVTKKTDIASVRLVTDPDTGTVTEVHYVNAPRDSASGLATGKRASIEIEVSGPPFKIKITIKF